MGAATVLVTQAIRVSRRSVFWWSVGLAGLVAATVAFWPAFSGASGISEAISRLPDPVIQAFGLREFGSPAGFLRGNLYELFVPLLFSIAAVTFVNGQTAADESAGRLELYLAQPVRRADVYAARLAACLVSLAALVTVTIVVQLAMDAAMGLSIGADRVAAAAVLCGLLAALYGGVAYLVACLAPRPSMVLGIGIGLTLAGYVVAALFPLATALKAWKAISPWDWAFAGDPLANGLDLWRAGVLLLVSVGLAIVGTFVVPRRDVAAA
jgi:ABC-2 type transport system permease protein